MSESQDTAQEKAIEAEFREYVRGNLPDQDDPDAHWWTGIVRDDQVQDVMGFVEEHYEPLTDGAEKEFKDTRVARRLLRDHGTSTWTDALQEGNLGQLSFASGLVAYNLDFSAFRALDELESLWRDYPTLQMYLYAKGAPEGPTGMGKTDFAYLNIEIGRRVYKDISVASNNEDDEFKDITTWSGLVEWLKSTDGKKVFLFDEAAQVLQFDDMSSGKVVSKLLKLLRKHHGNIIMIGHTGRDVPRDVRRQMLIAKKESKKKVVVGTGLHEENETIDIADEMLTIDNLPPTRLGFDSYDDSTFEFDVGAEFTANDDEVDAVAAEDDEGDAGSEVDTGGAEVDTSKEEAVIDYLTSDEGFRPVGERHGVSHEVLRNWVQSYRDEDE